MGLKEHIKKILISEIAQRIVDSLVQKWTQNTNLNPQEVKDYITEFSKISSSLPIEYRDVTKLNYSTVKKIVDAKFAKTRLKDLTTRFKKMEYEPGQAPSNNLLKKTIRKYNEIYPFLKTEDIRKLENYNWLTFLNKVEKLFQNELIKNLSKKIENEEPNWNREQILFYLNNVIEYYDEIPDNTPPINLLTMSEIEMIVDAILATKKTDTIKVDVSDIPKVIHPKKNLTIYAPTGKPDCIRLANGRSWCTSREGESNLYYNYRFDKNLTLYYVINEDLPFDDLNFASVILVATDKTKRLADGSNSGRYAGSTELPWSEIVSKIPKLNGLEEIFVPKPLSEEENYILSNLRRMRIPDTNLFEWFDDFKKREDISKLNYSTEDLIELWLEINSPSLTNNQYMSLTPDLKKKFISLGMDLNKIQLENSETTVLNYYIKKKIEKILKKRLSDLNETDVILLNTPMLKNEKISLKDKFLKEVRVQDPKKPNEVNIDLRERSSNREITRFTQLYGVEELFKSIDPNIDYFSVVADKNSNFDFDFDKMSLNLKNLDFCNLQNCTSKFPMFIRQSKKISLLRVQDSRISQVPDWVDELDELIFLTISTETKLSPELMEKLDSKPFFTLIQE